MPVRRHAMLCLCTTGALLVGPAIPAAHALAPSPQPALACAQPGPVKHAASGLDLGGLELATPSNSRTANVIDSALSVGPLPPGARANGNRVTLPTDAGDFTITVQPTRMPGDLPFAPVATTRFLGPEEAVVLVSDRAPADLIRQAVAARLVELAAIATDRAANWRPDVTSGLTEGVLTTADGNGRIPLSPRDLGRVSALKMLGDQLPGTKARTAALGAAVALGLLDPPAGPVHQTADNKPLVGPAAAKARADSIGALVPGSKEALAKVLDLAAKAESQPTLAEIRDERDCQRSLLRTGADGAIAQRDEADARLTEKINSGPPQLPVIPQVIVGSGWAATVDYLTLPPLTGPVGPLPSVLAVAGGPGVVNNLGEFRLTQPAMDNELPGAPFQPGDFAENRNDFVLSSDFGRAVGVAGALGGMPTYQARVTAIETRPDGQADGWPADARYRLTTSAARTLYARSVDVATGLGLPRIAPFTGQLSGRTFVDPESGYQVRYGPGDQPKIMDSKGNAFNEQLPKEEAWLLGAQNIDGIPTKLTDPFLLDPQGRPTERLVADPSTGYTVDPGTRQVYDPSDRPVDPAELDPELRARLGFLPNDGYRGPRFVTDTDSGYSVHPVTKAVIRTTTGDPVEWKSLPPSVRTRLDDLVRRHRVQYGGENTSAAYRSTDDLLVVGGGAGGASEVEQSRWVARTVTWGARRAKLQDKYPAGPAGAMDPQGLRKEWDTADPKRKGEIERDLSFVGGGGFNRRNTLPGIGAFSLPVWDEITRTTDLPDTVRYTTDGRFQTTQSKGTARSYYSRIVYTIGQETEYPGGAADLLGPDARLFGAFSLGGKELNGLMDATDHLRVLGAAGVTGGVLKLTGIDQDNLGKLIASQARALPPDARDIRPSIRYHAQRIAELNRTYQP